jgi:hypothetical protein
LIVVLVLRMFASMSTTTLILPSLLSWFCAQRQLPHMHHHHSLYLLQCSMVTAQVLLPPLLISPT